MTAINVLIQRDAVHMATDTAGIAGPDDEIICFMAKQVRLPSLPAIFASRGYAQTQKDIGTALFAAAFASVDDLMARAETVLAAACERCDAQWSALQSQDGEGGEFEIVFCGWSETAGPCAWLIRRRRATDGWSWESGSIATRAIAPCNADIFEVYAGVLTGAGALSQKDGPLDPLIIGLMNAQRVAFPVGGHIDFTTISAAGVSTRRLWEWDDRIGVPVDRSDVRQAFRGDMIADGTITARTILAGEVKAIHMAAESITAENGAIKNLSVQSLKIGDNAVIVPIVQSAGNVGGNNATQTVLDILFNIDTTGLAGKPITIFAAYTAGLGYGNPSNHKNQVSYVSIDGVLLASPGGGVIQFNTGFNVARTFTASGGVEQHSAAVQWNGEIDITLAGATMCVWVAKR